MKTKEGSIATLILIALVIGALVYYESGAEERRTQAVRAEGEKQLTNTLEDQITGATGRPAKCRVEEPLFVELIPEKTYRAIVLCDDGEILLSTVIDVTRFGADDELYWQTDGFRPASKEIRR